MKSQSNVILWFGRCMLAKLVQRFPKNSNEPLLGNGKDRPTDWYLQRLQQETIELKKALDRVDYHQQMNLCQGAIDTKRRAVIEECCDVANFAAAIAEQMCDQMEDEEKTICCTCEFEPTCDRDLMTIKTFGAPDEKICTLYPKLKAAAKAAETGSHKDLQEYLRVRREG